MQDVQMREEEEDGRIITPPPMLDAEDDEVKVLTPPPVLDTLPTDAGDQNGDASGAATAASAATAADEEDDDVKVLSPPIKKARVMTNGDSTSVRCGVMRARARARRV